MMNYSQDFLESRTAEMERLETLSNHTASQIHELEISKQDIVEMLANMDDTDPDFESVCDSLDSTLNALIEARDNMVEITNKIVALYELGF